MRVGSGLGWLGVGFAADYFKRPERRKEPKARFLVSGTKPLQQEMIAIRILSDGVTANSFRQRDGMICVGMLKAG